jgi:tRNA (guanine-N7-)-methyltransferase
MIPKEKPIHKTKLHGRKKSRSSGIENDLILKNIFPKYKLRLNKQLIHSYKNKAIELEVGFGFGEHIFHQAENNKNKKFIGVEPFLSGIISLVKKIDEKKITNIQIYNGNAIDVIDAMQEFSLGAIYILFPDPWPKKKHHKRRLISKYNLDKFSKVLKKGGKLFIATDHMEYQYWILKNLLNHSDFRWICSDSDDFKLKPYPYPETKYEKKALSNKRVPIYLNFEKK